MPAPKVSFVIPTLNAISVLEKCLRSIAIQVYPKNKIEILIADGGSTDGTAKLARRYKAKILTNKLKTGEAGKAVGAKASAGELIALIDSDNILPDKFWLKKMVKPFADQAIIATEPIKYTYRKKDPFLTRYFASLGMNDPLCLFLGNYDRLSVLTNRWTNLNFSSQDKKGYLKILLNKLPIPTIGANGFIIRKSALQSIKLGNYLFDIDILINLIKSNLNGVFIAKVKTGIVHTFVEDDPFKFFKKQLRRINDMSYHRSKNNRALDWQNTYFWRIIWFQLQCFLVIPIVYQTLKGLIRTRDKAWLFHPLAIYSTWIIYLYGWIKGKIKPAQSNRRGWRQ